MLQQGSLGSVTAFAPSPMQLLQTSLQWVPLAWEDFHSSPCWRCSMEASYGSQPTLSSLTEKLSGPGRNDVPVSDALGGADVGLVLVSDCWLWPRGQEQNMGKRCRICSPSCGEHLSTCRDSGHSLATSASTTLTR